MGVKKDRRRVIKYTSCIMPSFTIDLWSYGNLKAWEHITWLYDFRPTLQYNYLKWYVSKNMKDTIAIIKPTRFKRNSGNYSLKEIQRALISPYTALSNHKQNCTSLTRTFFKGNKYLLLKINETTAHSTRGLYTEQKKI